MSVTISPSILNCDIANLASELAKISNADFAHVDIMDNHFVPNLSWGLPVLEAVVKQQVLPVDAHLMIEDPDRWAPAYAEAGSASVTFHVEAAQAPVRLANELHRLGVKAGLALRPGTSVEAVQDILSYFDMLLVMTVEPGFGGQKFLEPMMSKVSRARALAKQGGLELAIQVDGGVTRETIVTAAEAGADVFVAGSAVFKAEDAESEVQALREIAAGHCH